MKYTQHTVLVTGGATGIGFALAEKFHCAGNRVVLVGRTEAALAKAIDALPGAELLVGDISSAPDRLRLVQRYPNVSVLINNAAIRIETPFAEISDAELQHELDVNFLAPLFLTRAYLPLMKRHPAAAIVNVTSGLALWPREVAAMYGASKAALHSFSKSLRWQLEGTSVRVFEVLPPMVETSMTAGRGRREGKITAAQLADEFWRDFQSDHYEMLIGQTKILHWLRRLSPALTDRIMRVQPQR